jgi:hypothetical protein
VRELAPRPTAVLAVLRAQPTIELVQRPTAVLTVLRAQMKVE